MPPTKNQPFPSAGAYYNIPLNLQPTYTQEWDLSFQRQVRADWLFTATYLGNKTTHSWVQTEGDPGVYIPGTCNGKPCSATSNLSQRRVLYLLNPVAGALYSTMAQSDGGANSEYNGLLLSARRRLSHNYTILANYTYSHCVSEANFVGELAGAGYQNPYNRDADRGNCAFDLRQIFNLSVVGMSPTVNWNGVARVLLENWQIAPIFSVHSGNSFTPLSGVDNSMTGVNLDRPNVIGNPYVRDTSTLLWLNPGGFAANPVGTFGDAGTYSLRGPGYFDVDLGVSRSFAVHEAQRLEVRFEAFNATNHTHLALPVATQNNAHFGQITSAGDPRILQFAMKYQF